MSSLRILLTLASILFAMMIAFGQNKSLEGSWYVQSYQNPTPKYRDTTCHACSIKLYNETSFESRYSYKLNSGEDVVENLIGILSTSGGPSAVLKKEPTGELNDYCKITSMSLSKSGNTLKAVSSCYYDVCCLTKNKTPKDAELQEVEELCPGFTKTDNNNC